MPSQAALRALLTDPLAPWGVGAFFAADLINNRCKLGGRYVGRLESIPGISITRATSAYYTDAQGNLSLFPSGAARIGNRGLLCEGAATNICLQSADFSTTWSAVSLLAFGSGSTVNATTAPDGTTTADLITPSTANAQHRVDQSITISSATSYTVSVYAKPAGYNSLWLRLTDGVGTPASVNFNVATGQITLTAAGTGSITALANGWYRCSITATSAGTSGTFRINVIQDDGTNSFAGDGASGLYLWGAQLETGVATSYIPTTTGSATRNADVISIGSVTGLSLPYTVYAKYRRAYDSGAEQILIQLDDGTANERCRLVVGSTDVFRAIMTDGGSDTADESVAGALAVGTTYNGAARFEVNNVIACRAGTLSAGDVSASVPASPSAIRIGGGISGANAFGGYLEQIAVYSSAYANAALQGLAP